MVSVMPEHWPPRVGDRLYQRSREDEERWPHGEIVAINRDRECPENSEVIILFKKHGSTITKGENILTYDGHIHWRLENGCIYVDGEFVEEIDRLKWGYIFIGEEYSYPDEVDIKSLWFSDFDGNWSSSDGGNERWEIE